ncbi:hypothetical protein [Dyadobacter sandarakinus]|uniref:Cytochrome c domain-containing protein n=1 Tax=Dyadobacter sandarakinus TaxID=2747268 RepID=A0ABX7I5G6_9BACT|nr:hypothetical protein [Dyadobacter sandarakinus]QRR01339.1 hypothetical protein HWI92_10720 [Dyadobacter sandarakinus]
MTLNRAQLVRILYWGAAALLMGGCNHPAGEISNRITFKKKLSEYALFRGEMRNLVPADGVMPIQISSALFTDYADKQRLIRIPAATKLVIRGDGLPVFPDGSLLVKTFFYPKANHSGRQIIETRLLLYSGGHWNAATYRWNAAQTEADLLTGGAVVPVYFQDSSGKSRHLEYKIPAQRDCGTCHRSGNELVPLGPQVKNLNRNVNRDGKSVNQLGYFMENGLFAHGDRKGISTLPDYRDASLPLKYRARSYLEINYAHCHRENGSAAGTSLSLSYTTPFDQTGIAYNRENIVIRMQTMGEYHMPKIGTTIPDAEGVQLIRDYIKSLAREDQ